MEHPTWKVRYVVVHPKGSEVFGPLLACYESRQLWRKKYDCTGGYIAGAYLPIPNEFRFHMPYICYETDIFTVFKAWNPGHTTDRAQSETTLSWWDPFLGLERDRIQHAGLRLWGERNPFAETVTSLDVELLPALRTLSLFMLGPDPGLERGVKPVRPGWVQMSPLVLQRDFHFGLRDISPSQLEHHPMFRDFVISRCSTTGQLDRPLRHLVLWVKAWLWHFVYCGREVIYDDVFLADLGPEYMIDPSGWEGKPCPLGLSGCQSGIFKHSQRDIRGWNPPWEVKIRFLCEEEWLKDLEKVGLFDEDRTAAGDFAAFYRFRQEETDRLVLLAAHDIVRGMIQKRKITPKWNMVWSLSLGG